MRGFICARSPDPALRTSAFRITIIVVSRSLFCFDALVSMSKVEGINNIGLLTKCTCQK